MPEKIHDVKDTYRTLANPGKETLYKEKGSKFYGYAFPVLNEEEVKLHLVELKKQHPNAGHFCYAWQLGAERPHYRVSDDGEPSNSAGMPIYGQLQAFELTNILLVSVRYFGGTKLGVGGLIQAYKYSAKITLEGANIVERTLDVVFQLSFDYALMNKVMRIIKEKKLNLLNQELGMQCVFRISVRKKEADATYRLFDHLYKMKIEKRI